MSVEKNKAIVCGYFEEILTKKNLDAMEEYFDSELTFNGECFSIKQFVAFIESFYLISFPDLCPTIEDQIAKDDKVVTRVYFHGTHNGEFQGLAATNKRVKFLGIAIDRIINGKVKEMWHEADIWGLLRQLGVVAKIE
ncbi:MAG: ester cyclase [Candidatus Hodarchaeales archaeon]|jgi:predicted ester cyclase